ncbi:signal transduction histidine kinase [Novosphingobium kunmingense]|uniref:histidine kinase n=1 Tax=Novosphingobium kunmingense TaxID=1211806 RepID=A0A2N0H3N3_9SPHN|nr:response regulator [Novosphingobium kunmingense]PKB13500.1 signal transduction histidine kinase [Novosphingobium kunmingense]
MSQAGISESPAKILIVDDDDRNLLALSEVLAPIAEVVCAISGRDALRQLLREEFAVILLDVFMPDLDGYETAALIRQREQTARTPIIFLSAVNKETEHLMRGYEMGAVDYVFKPVDPVVIKSKVAVFVDLFRTRRQLETSEKRQTSILRALPMAIYEITERNGEMVRRFRGGDLVHFLGDEAESVLTGEREWQEWVHPDDRLRLSQDADPGNESVVVEYRWIGPRGSRHHILDQRVRTGSGNAHGWAGSLLDITERKELEARLVHAGKLDALGQLTGGVAHDFNNLLAAMLGGISILERRLELGEREQLVVDQMRHAATQGTELVRRMMAFARQQDLTPTSIDPASLCESVAGLVSNTLGGKIEVVWNCPDAVHNLFVDRGQLELAVMNLIINARDAMPDGGTIQVSISEGKTADPDKPMLSIVVADTGTGIPDDILTKVIEPFFTTKEAGKGTGLGLSMVSGFAHQSGGEIRIDSKVGKGTRIELILPATRSAVNEGVPAHGSGENLDWIKGKAFVLIDDDDAVRVVLGEQLRDAGGTVRDFASGNAAIADIERDREAVDFVLSDFAMPGLDGIKTLQKIGELLPEARRALMTGNADDPRLTITEDIPVLRKPLSLQQLSEVMIA